MKILVPITNSSDIDVFNPNIYNTEFFFRIFTTMVD